VKGLKEDLAASKKSPGEIVGLDFDPFLNAQDIAERYLVGKITPKGDHYWVEVFGVWGGRKIRILMSFPSSPLKTANGSSRTFITEKQTSR
jgi:hypothetical protein